MCSCTPPFLRKHPPRQNTRVDPCHHFTRQSYAASATKGLTLFGRLLNARGNSVRFVIPVKTTLEVIAPWNPHPDCDDDDEEENMALFVVPFGMQSRRHHHHCHCCARELDSRRGWPLPVRGGVVVPPSRRQGRGRGIGPPPRSFVSRRRSSIGDCETRRRSS